MIFKGAMAVFLETGVTFVWDTRYYSLHEIKTQQIGNVQISTKGLKNSKRVTFFNIFIGRQLPA